MKLTKQNVCVYIENEAQLQQAKELLEKYGEEIDERVFYLSNNNEDFLCFFLISKEWGLSYKENECQITLPALEVILKNQGDIESCEFCNTVCTIDEMRQDEEGCWFCNKCLESII